MIPQYVIIFDSPVNTSGQFDLPIEVYQVKARPECIIIPIRLVYNGATIKGLI